MSVGKELEKIRKKNKDSLRKLAEKTGVTHSYIQQIENGTRPSSLEFLEKVTIIYSEDKEALELTYCKEKIPKSIYSRIDEMTNIILKEDSFNIFFLKLFSKLDINGKKQVMELIVSKLEKLSDDEKYKKDEKLLEEIREFIKKIG